MYLSNYAFERSGDFQAMKLQLGLTLVELMMTVAVLAIVTSLAVPGYARLTAANRITTATNELVAAIHYARSEAIRRGQTVVICKSNDGLDCTVGGNHWESGWIAFVEQNTNNIRDAAEVLLHTWGAAPAGITIRPASAQNNIDDYLRFNARGIITNISGDVAFNVCSNAPINGRAVMLTSLRPRTGQVVCA